MNKIQYLKHYGVLLTGTAGAQVLNLAAYPILTRLYAPVDFGVFALFIAATAVPTAVACGRYELALAVAKRHVLLPLYSLCIALAVCCAVLSTVGSAVYFGLTQSEYLFLAPLIGFAIFFGGFCAATGSLSLRYDGYRLNSIAIFVRTLFGIGAQALFGAQGGLNAAGLIYGYCIGLCIHALFLGWGCRQTAKLRAARLRRLRVALQKFWAQARIDIPSTLVGAVANNALNWIINALYGPVAVGFYAMASRLAITPLSVFNDTLSRVFYQKAAKADRETGTFWPELKTNLALSSLIATIILGCLLLLSDSFIALYLGGRWSPTADVLVILAPMLAVRSISVSVATSVFIFKRPDWLFYLNCALLIAYTAAYLVAFAANLQEDHFLQVSAVSVSTIYVAFLSCLVLSCRKRHNVKI